MEIGGTVRGWNLFLDSLCSPDLLSRSFPFLVLLQMLVSDEDLNFKLEVDYFFGNVLVDFVEV